MNDGMLIWGGVAVMSVVATLLFYPFWRERWEEDLARLWRFIRRKR